MFTRAELHHAIKKLKNGKCKDTSGIVAEMIKAGGETLETHLLRLYNDILQPDAKPPDQWKRATITIIHKSGDVHLPQNYRPISIIPLIYKLFARLLYNRLEPKLDLQQTPDQAGFRHNYSTEDHLFTMTILLEQSHEYQLPLWAATVDFKKAFDTVNHNRLWTTLRDQKIPQAYITLLQQLYKDQSACVKTDTKSREFNILRGVKQGDPLSSLLFNALLEEVFKKLRESWDQKAFGIPLGYDNTAQLTNLRFADDVLLLAQNQRHITQMLSDLQHHAAPFGLEIHPDKTKILTTSSRRVPQQVQVNDKNIEVLSQHSYAKYLGRKLSFHNYQSTEIDNRIAAAWRKFGLLRHELTSKSYPLKSRLRLFDGTITPTIMYGCTSWTLTKDLELLIQRTQRRMLRLIIGTPRRRTPNTTTTQPATPPQQAEDPDDSTDDVASNTSTPDLQQLITITEEEETEPWPDFIKRATHIASETIKKFDIPEWTTILWQRQWRWASRIAQQNNDRWSLIAALWDPTTTQPRRAQRQQGRPQKRWSDEINN